MNLSFRPPREVAWGLSALLAVLLLAAPAGAGEHLRFLPANTKVVVTINVAALAERDREAWKKLGRLLCGAHLTPELKGNKLAVGDVTSLTFAAPFVSWPGGMIIVRGKVDAKLLTEQARKCVRMSRLTVEELKPVRGQLVPIFHRRVTDLAPLLPLPEKLAAGLKAFTTGSDVYFTAVDEETLILTVVPQAGLVGLLQPPPDAVIRRALLARPKETKPRISANLLELLKKQDSRACLTAVIMDDALDPQLALLVPELNTTFQRWKHLVGTIRADEEFEAVLAATGKDVDEAVEMEKFVKDNAGKMVALMSLLSPIAKQKEVLAALAKSIRASRKDDVVTVTGKISSDRIRLLFVPHSR